MQAEGFYWAEEWHGAHIILAYRLSPWLIEHLEVLGYQSASRGQFLLVRARTPQGAIALEEAPRCPSRGSKSEINRVLPHKWVR